MPLLAASLPFERNYNEGWNAYHAARALDGGPFYAGNPLRPVNYPFLSFFLAAWLAPLAGGVLMAGRLLNLLGLASIGLTSAWIVRRLGGKGIGSICTAFLAVGFVGVQAPRWVGVDDPQLLAEALMLLALAHHLGRAPTTRRLAMTAALMALAGFTKHNLVAIPCAITLDIAVNHRRVLWQWLLLSTGAILALFGATYALAGGDFLTELLAPREWGLHHLLPHLRKFFNAFKIPLVALGVFFARVKGPHRHVAIVAWGTISFLSSVAFAGGAGVSYNNFIDMAVFLAITGGLAIDRCSRAPMPAGRGRTMLVLLLPAIIAAPILDRIRTPIVNLVRFSVDGTPAAQRTADFEAARRLLTAHPGPAICESLLLCFDAGKPLVVDPYNSYQAILAGRVDDEAVTGLLKRRAIAVVQLRTRARFRTTPNGRRVSDFDGPTRFTNDFFDALLENYVLVSDSSVGAVYLPK
ncbi:hypothetical protein GCM10011611_10010 [Aliidongia dinghuensis]|uniref:Uncharacterized protein n=1 Tax=Aliidongia dinghuensis TaxID=1867774 RepID=A0A8J3E235_9PROT|nr:hypothetical protein [Aliidongia dinghuensis]GGF06482.1 hypothetical protein GCM10011611_10010 [Aliidongia dinghuensis]